MKKVFLVLTNIIIITGLYAQQKPAINSGVYAEWPSAEGGTISNDGKYALYDIRSGLSFYKEFPEKVDKVVIKSTDGKWKMELPGFNGYPQFTTDSKFIIFPKSADSIGIITLGSSSVSYITHISSFQLQKEGSGAWLAYLMSDPVKRLIVQNLETGNKLTYDSVSNYIFNNNGNILVLQTESRQGNSITQSLKWINLTDGNKTTLYEGAGIENLVLDEEGSQLAFEVTSGGNNDNAKSIWYYKAGTDKAVMLADSQSEGIGNGLKLSNITGFSKDGSQLFFQLDSAEQKFLPNPDAVKLNVWSYTDTKLQSEQLKDLDPQNSWAPSQNYKAVINLNNHQIIRLLQKNENSWVDGGDYILVDHTEGGANDEAIWNRTSNHTYYLESTRDGNRKQLTDLSYNVSLEGKYLVYFDGKQKNFFSYEIATGITRNITQSIHTDWTFPYVDDNVSLFPRGLAGWTNNDAEVIIYDKHDIWEVDPKGEKPPVNLTNGYGRRHNIVFDLLQGGTYSSPKVIALSSKQILIAFNPTNKDNGFYSKILSQPGDPELLTMGSYVYDIPNNGYASDAGRSPVKAKDANGYLVWRESATESPNYFFTTDFKTLTPLSNIHPEKDYNWYTTQLCTWKSLDGRTLQGILYKPENFDPNKKYPVIFYYYERLSAGLNDYLKPQFLSGFMDINIPTYVSNGYLVFSPDIYYNIGDPMQGSYNSIVSAIYYLSKLPFVDAKKIAAQGGSFGGIQTNYIVTHSNLLAAACSSSGVADWISEYGGLMSGGNSIQGMYEGGQNRIGASLWQKPDAYIKNSPIFKADKVTTPFLMMHTLHDGICLFPNAVEFFTALRRLGKTAWMLEYEDGDHGIDDKSAIDFSIRMRQFFDYYLKGARAPEWMVKGIPAKLKGIDNGLVLEPGGIRPGPNLLINK